MAVVDKARPASEEVAKAMTPAAASAATLCIMYSVHLVFRA